MQIPASHGLVRSRRSLIVRQLINFVLRNPLLFRKYLPFMKGQFSAPILFLVITSQIKMVDFEMALD